MIKFGQVWSGGQWCGAQDAWMLGCRQSVNVFCTYNTYPSAKIANAVLGQDKDDAIIVHQSIGAGHFRV